MDSIIMRVRILHKDPNLCDLLRNMKPVDNVTTTFETVSYFGDYHGQQDILLISDDINALIDSVIKANNNLKDSLNSNNFEMIGKDITSLQSIINQLETARANELEEEEKKKKDESRGLLFRNDNTVDANEVTNELVQNTDVLNNVIN